MKLIYTFFFLLFAQTSYLQAGNNFSKESLNEIITSANCANIGDPIAQINDTSESDWTLVSHDAAMFAGNKSIMDLDKKMIYRFCYNAAILKFSQDSNDCRKKGHGEWCLKRAHDRLESTSRVCHHLARICLLQED